MYMKHWRNISKIEHCSPIVHCTKIKCECFEMGNFSYTQH